MTFCLQLRDFFPVRLVYWHEYLFGISLFDPLLIEPQHHLVVNILLTTTFVESQVISVISYQWDLSAGFDVCFRREKNLILKLGIDLLFVRIDKANFFGKFHRFWWYALVVEFIIIPISDTTYEYLIISNCYLYQNSNS